MKFSIEKREIAALTAQVHRAAASRNTIPVLSGLLLSLSHEEGLTLTATDMEIGIKASSSNVDIQEEGAVLVNANYFNDLMRLLPDTRVLVELNTTTSKLDISYGRSTSHINIYQEQEYPPLPISRTKFLFSLPQVVLKEALRKTAFAAASNHFRQVFTGVLFDILPDGVLKVVASDTHRLAYYSYTLTDQEIEPAKFIIPLRAVQELLRFLEDDQEDINISLSDNNVVFYRDQFLLLSRLIEGNYPNYEQVIPTNFNTVIEINPGILAESLERVKVMPSDDKFKIHYVHFSFNQAENQEIILNTYSEAVGEILEVIEDFEGQGDQELKITFNTTYFLDAIKIFDQECEKINIKLSGSLGPALINNPEKDNYLYVLVPMRTRA